MTHINFGKGETEQKLLLKYANRHGLIAGATGTGKTVTLQTLAEGFSKAGVPVFIPDVKGDLSGIITEGGGNKKVIERIESLKLDWHKYQPYPATFWDIYGENGARIRVSISEMGPVLLSRIFRLNDTQESILSVAFSYADKNGMLLLDIKDLKSVLSYIYDNAKEFSREYGNISKASLSTIQRKINALEKDGINEFFGEPSIQINDFFQKGYDGSGIINILSASKLINNPKLYSAFLIYLLSELFENLPEVGDAEKPKFVIFFDEAHLLFKNANNVLVEKIEQVVRLIRSKGVGVYFVTQSPLDVPESVLGQLGNRVQHALRAFTPKDQKAVKVAAQTFRTNPNFKTVDAITSVGVGEALVSLLDEKGMPTIVDRCLIYPPESQIGPSEEKKVTDLISSAPMTSKYKDDIDRESAHEILTKRIAEEAKEIAEAEEEAEKKEGQQKAVAKKSKKSNRQGYIETAVKSIIRTIGSKIGREIARGILGSILKK